jgi:hypothetical protein
MITEDLVKDIIKEQSLIIGEVLARQRATDSGVIKFRSQKLDDLYIEGNDSTVIEKLVNSYKVIFGQASVEVCINIIKKFPKEQVLPIVPESFKQAINNK